jgi:outer membrane immunogenic protein
VIAGVEYLRVALDGKPLMPALGLHTGTDREIDLVRARLSVRPDQCCGSGPLSVFASAAGVPAGHALWSGVYVGAYGGYGWGRERHTDTRFLSGSIPAPVAYAYDLDGGLAGVQLGVNVQRGNFVFGGEVSLGGGEIKGSLTDCVVRGGGGSQRTTCTSKVEGLLTAMARVGFAKDSWLVYGTGGWALANTYFQGVRTDAGGAGIGPFAADNTYANGPAFGGGVEVALGHGISAGVEYLHANLSVTSQPFNGNGIGDRDFGLNLVRGRVNMKLN